MWLERRVRTVSMLAVTGAVCFLVAACEHGARSLLPNRPESRMETVHPKTIRLVTPDSSYMLPPEERAKVRPGYDADALERLLAAVMPDARQIILEGFQVPRPGELQPGEWVTPPVHVGDPELQPLVDEVWATAWANYPHLLDDDSVVYPGKEIAKRRREAVRQREESRT